MGVRVRTSGSFDHIQSFFDKVLKNDIYSSLDRLGRMGADALAANTPVDTGRTADSWSYRIINDGGRSGIEWFNDNEVNGVQIAVILQYGHGTGTGGYVAGIDYINPALEPIFYEIEEAIWKELNA